VSAAPLRTVLESRRGPRSQRVELPDGSVAIVCGPAPYFDRLECGHDVVAHTKAKSRRCSDCETTPAADEVLW
jgi:hypothetical protein